MQGCLLAAIGHKLAREVGLLALYTTIRGLRLFKDYVLLSTGEPYGPKSNVVLRQEDYDERIGAPRAKDSCYDHQRNAKDHSAMVFLGCDQTTLEVKHFLSPKASSMSQNHPNLPSAKLTDVEEAIYVIAKSFSLFGTQTNTQGITVDFPSDTETYIHIDEERFMRALKGLRLDAKKDTLFYPTAVCGFASFLKPCIDDRKARIQWRTGRNSLSRRRCLRHWDQWGNSAVISTLKKAFVGWCFRVIKT